MKQLRQILLTMLVAVFLANTITASAFAACNCAEMASAKSQATQEMPCHDMQKAETDQAQTDDSEQQKASICTKCACGDCKVPSQAMLGSFNKAPHHSENDRAALSFKDMTLTSMAYGIDNPPKHIS
jgi:uncharacterized protein involved in copper resistance